MRRGEYLDERIPDMEGTVKEYFGPVTDTLEYKGSDLLEYGSKKDKIGVAFEERSPSELGPDELEAAQDAVDSKNDFLLEATGRDAKARRDSMKRAVEDDPDEDFEA